MAIRLAIAQINTTVGDLSGNCNKITFYLEEARRLGADLIIFPEMAITGYPPEDLLLKPDFVEAAMQSLQGIVPATRGLTAVVGCIYADDVLYNAAGILHNGNLEGIVYKQHLPNYGVFDENRYFQSGKGEQVFKLNSTIFGVSICEDIWYPNGPPERQSRLGGAELLINISSSPYHLGKGIIRERMLATRATDNTAFVAYCNLVGGQDELVFDGQSLICGPRGEVIARAKQFEEELLVADLNLRAVLRGRLYNPRRPKIAVMDTSLQRVELSEIEEIQRKEYIKPSIASPLAREAEVYQALVLGLRDYVRKNGFRKVVLGLSGGVDSSLTAAIATDALGAENVTGVAMPSRFSSSHSLEDAEKLVSNLGIKYLIISIDQTFQAFINMLQSIENGELIDLAQENLQPRIRGTLLMALSNQLGLLVLTTGNKSEVGVGYSTLYGDTAGGFAVIKDVPKMLVYNLCHYRNRISGIDLIPQRVLEKAPSAELKPDQKDTDSLPEYAVLDPILNFYVEESYSLSDIISHGFKEEMVRKVISLVDRNEYKRRQSPPGVKISARAFGKDWRLPITNKFSL
jgi:NAD+ synthase (glutamine-hydrolysing)